MPNLSFSELQKEEFNMKLNELIDRLNDDLSNERKHMLFYLYHSSYLKGLHHEELGELLKGEAESEMIHVKEFQDLIIGLGGKPTTDHKPFPLYSDPAQIFSYALQMEDEVVENYVNRIEDTQLIQEKVQAKWVELFLEDQILDSRKDADKFRQMIAQNT